MSAQEKRLELLLDTKEARIKNLEKLNGELTDCLVALLKGLAGISLAAKLYTDISEQFSKIEAKGVKE
jgi:hypothetical protein